MLKNINGVVCMSVERKLGKIFICFFSKYTAIFPTKGGKLNITFIIKVSIEIIALKIKNHSLITGIKNKTVEVGFLFLLL